MPDDTTYQHYLCVENELRDIRIFLNIIVEFMQQDRDKEERMRRATDDNNNIPS